MLNQPPNGGQMMQFNIWSLMLLLMTSLQNLMSSCPLGWVIQCFKVSEQASWMRC